MVQTYTKESFFKKHRKKFITVIILFVLALFLYWQDNSLVVTNYVYKSNKVTEENDGFKMVVVSDLHKKEFGKDNKKLIEKVKGCNPDAIMIPGDFVDSPNYESCIELAKKLVKIAPVYYVTGNHEVALNDGNILSELEFAGVKVFDDLYGSAVGDDKPVLINDSLFVFGVDDRVLDNSTGNIEYALAGNTSKKETLNILLAHEPQYFEDYASTDVDIVLCGHAHGGQFRIPRTNIAFVAPDQGFLPKYTSGVHESNGTTMYISRGLGNSIIPIRIFNRPEILEITLKSE
ncbi:MAG: metallophosphoesterase [Lachnospiraceae bacterium]|nr:metallophosphoesterase [Lachnospiraceae bacterium]